MTGWQIRHAMRPFRVVLMVMAFFSMGLGIAHRLGYI